MSYNTITGNTALIAAHDKVVREFRKLDDELTALRNAVKKLRDAKGRHHTELSYQELMKLLPP